MVKYLFLFHYYLILTYLHAEMERFDLEKTRGSV